MAKQLYPHRGSASDGDQGLGRIHAYYGPGVGKSTRAMGLAVRAAGAGLRVGVVQFMKSGETSETQVFKLIPNLEYYCPGEHPFITKAGPEERHFHHARSALAKARDLAEKGVQVLVCDEILNTLLFKVLDLDDVLGLVEACRGRVELVMTGSDAPEEIIAAADYVTKFVQEKHPYYKGLQARKGIEL